METNWTVLKKKLDEQLEDIKKYSIQTTIKTMYHEQRNGIKKSGKSSA